MAWTRTMLLLLLTGRGDTTSRPKGSGHDDDSFTYMDDESASNHTSSIYADDAMPGDICPFAIDQYTTDYDFVTMSATKCGSTACCKFQPLTQYILTWKKYEIEPVTVGVEVVVIDRQQDVTSTSTELITTALVFSIYGAGTTTLDPGQWIKNGTFDGGYDIPTRTTITTDVYGSEATIKYPSAYIELVRELGWYGSLPIVSAGTTSCLQFDGGRADVPSPTFVSTPKMTIDPTDPKGIFYTLIGEAEYRGHQIPGANFGTSADNWPGDVSWSCGGALATELFESWRPTEQIISIYSSCFCSQDTILPAAVARTVSVLLDKTTRYDRLPRITTDPTPKAQRTSDSLPTRTSSPKLDTPTEAATSSNPVNTVQLTPGRDEQTLVRASNSASTIAGLDPLQNVVSQSEATTAGPSAVSSSTPSVSTSRPSTPVQTTGTLSPTASSLGSGSSRTVSSIEKSMAPPSSSPEGSRGPSPSTQSTIESQSIRTQSDTAVSVQSAGLETASLPETSISLSSPMPMSLTDPELSSQRTTTPQGAQNEPLTVNSQSEESASFRTASPSEQSGQPPSSSSKSAVDTAPSSQRKTQSASVLVKPVPASSQSAATSSDTPAAAVVVADGQLSMVSVESSSESGAQTQSSSAKIGDIIADGIGLTKESAIESTSQDSVTTEASPTTRTAADTKTSSAINTTSQPSRTSESSQTRSPTSQKSTSRVIASPTRATSSSRTSETTCATGDIIASVMGLTRSTSSAGRLGSEVCIRFAVGLLIFYLAA